MSYLDKMFGLSGKVALVTGAGQGIGEAIALGLSQAGAQVLFAGRTLSKVETAAEKGCALGGKCQALYMDVSSPESIEAAFAFIQTNYGRLDILFNNAGVTIKGKAEELSLQDWQTVINTNLTGSFLCAQQAAKIMLPQGAGKIINVISTYAFVGRYMRVAYASSKGGELQMTKTMAMEWAPQGVCVNALAPTATDTPMTSVYQRDQEARREMEKKIPMGRLALPEDMVGAALFLASPASDFVSGHAILVDGGFTAI